MENRDLWRVRTSLIFFVFALSYVFGIGSASGQADFGYARDRRVPVVSFTEILGEIGDPDRGPSLKIYGDGYVVVHYPRYMKRAGDYALQLGPLEMENLVRSLVDKNILEFDAAAVRQRKREAETFAQGGIQTPLFTILDASTTLIEVRLDRYRPAGYNTQEVRDVHKRITWYSLRSDAERHPQIEAIQNLAAAERELLALMQRQDLEKIQ